MARRTLITLAIILTVLAFLAAEADFIDDGSPLRYHHYRSTGLTSLRVAYQGDIELDENQRAIVRMSPDAALDVRERRFTSRRRLEVRPDASGRPTYTYEVGARAESPEAAEAYLSSIMDEILHRTTVGARARARGLLEREGVGELLREVAYLESNAARAIYLETAARKEGLDEGEARDIVRAAGREMTSSSRLRTTLVELADTWPAEWDLGDVFAEAAENIASSSEKSRALVELGRSRGIDGHARAFADAVSSIEASSEKGRAVIRLFELEPTAEVATALLSAADTIGTSSERRRVLVALAGRPGLPVAVYSEAIAVAADISSSSEKASALAEMAPYLSSAGAGPASGASGPPAELTAELTGQDPPVIETVPAAGPAEPSDALSPADRAAGDVPAAEPAGSGPEPAAALAPEPGLVAARQGLLRRYIETAVDIPSSSEAQRALGALAAATDLDEDLCRLWIDSATRVPATSVSADLLIDGTRVCPSSERVWQSYFDAVEHLSSSSEQRRSLMALLDREDLSEETLRAMEAAVARSIASSAERDAVLDRIETLRAERSS